MFYRHTDYIQLVCQTPVVPTHVALPLDLQPMKDLLKTARKCLDNNYLPSFIMTVGGILAFHYESILDLQDKCPLFLAYSAESGTGMYVNVVWDLNPQCRYMYGLAIFITIIIVATV